MLLLTQYPKKLFTNNCPKNTQYQYFFVIIMKTIIHW